MIRKTVERFERIIEWAGSIILVALLLIVWAQVASRYIFNNSIAWTEESARYIMIWGVMLGASIALRRGYLISINLFIQKAPKSLQVIARGLNAVLSLFFLGLLAYQGLKLVEIGANMESPALGIPYSWVYMAIPVGATLMIFAYFFRSRS